MLRYLQNDNVRNALNNQCFANLIRFTPSFSSSTCANFFYDILKCDSLYVITICYLPLPDPNSVGRAAQQGELTNNGELIPSQLQSQCGSAGCIHYRRRRWRRSFIT